ncbi:MAG: alpha/beta hydrolase [Myxococcales bacterium]
MGAFAKYEPLDPRARVRALRPVKALTAPKDPMVLLHPFALCTEVWRQILPALEEHHEVFPLKLPGHMGGCPYPRDLEHSIEHLTDLVEAQLNEKHLARAHLVGSSLGGWLALELARRGRALSVVAFAPGGGWRFGSAEHRRLVRKFRLVQRLVRLAGPRAALLGSSSLVRRLFLNDAVVQPTLLSPLEAALFIEAAWRCTAFSAVCAALPTQALTEPFTPTCPVRIVWGDKDRLLPLHGYSEHWRNALPEAEWVVLHGVGHLPMYDDPTTVVNVILSLTRAELETSRARARRHRGAC